MENEPFHIFVVHQSNFVTCSYALRLLVLQFYGLLQLHSIASGCIPYLTFAVRHSPCILHQ